MATKSLRLKIYGTEYPLKGEDEDGTRRAASYVDEMMNAIHTRIQDQPPLTVAVLSALNITQDLLKEREKQRASSAEVEKELLKLTNYLDECLNK